VSVLGIIQARMNSSRLQGKVLRDLGGITVLALMVHRLRSSACLSKVIVATTNSPDDDILVEKCLGLGIEVFRGDELDVLRRFKDAADWQKNYETIVRFTADCPFIDPEIVDEVVTEFFRSGSKYCSNRLPPPLRRTYPIGLDVEVFSRAGLLEAEMNSVTIYEREHVTPYFYTRSKHNEIHIMQLESDLSDIRLTIDTP
jgi:spore coat polysaccharide biosynthesis protein SpsF